LNTGRKVATRMVVEMGFIFESRVGFTTIDYWKGMIFKLNYFKSEQIYHPWWSNWMKVNPIALKTVKYTIQDMKMNLQMTASMKVKAGVRLLIAEESVGEL